MNPRFRRDRDHRESDKERRDRERDAYDKNRRNRRLNNKKKFEKEKEVDNTPRGEERPKARRRFRLRGGSVEDYADFGDEDEDLEDFYEE